MILCNYIISPFYSQLNNILYPMQINVLVFECLFTVCCVFPSFLKTPNAQVKLGRKLWLHPTGCLFVSICWTVILHRLSSEAWYYLGCCCTRLLRMHADHFINDSAYSSKCLSFYISQVNAFVLFYFLYICCILCYSETVLRATW